MTTANSFDLLGIDENDDPSFLVEKIASAPVKKAPVTGKDAAPVGKGAAKLPSKPLPPAQAVREARNEGGHGRGRGYGRGRGNGGFNRDSTNNEGSYANRGSFGGNEESDGRSFERRGGYGGPRGEFCGGDRRVSFANGDGEGGERQRRPYERHSGTGRG